MYYTGKEHYIAPLFWVHGEDEEITKEYICQMRKHGITSFIIEPRPHTGYLTHQWWNEIRYIIEEAANNGMTVWIFDDSDFPSGSCRGEITKEHPEFKKTFLKPMHIDAKGPTKESLFYIEQRLQKNDRVVAVLAAKRGKNPDELLGETLIDLTHTLKDGVLFWNVPQGKWRVITIVASYNCVEEHTKNHINVLEHGAVDAFIQKTYEPTYNNLKEYFGTVVQGFFTDEPRFGNFPSYYGALGNPNMPVPYSSTLIEELTKELGRNFVPYLPLLWYESKRHTSEIRYAYMHVVSQLFSKNYTQTIGNWCKEKKVKLIGHVIEENGAHARLGYGAGHFFRAMKGLDFSGLDIVNNIFPGYVDGTYDMPLFRVDVACNHWGLAKMASSASHIEPQKQGITMCESFGAYGWHEGLKLMKWITDHICVRGVNYIVPHAFTMQEFPDPDCPPHFYARGNNPQWQYFDRWSSYASRVCHLLTHGVHKATAAVLYHAEAEWAGAYHPFEETVRALACNQIDCDIVPIDTLLDASISYVTERSLVVNQESYEVLIIPYAEVLPHEFERKLITYITLSLPVIFIHDLPKNGFIQQAVEPSLLHICTYDTLSTFIIDKNMHDINIDTPCDYLRHYHYKKEKAHIYFLVNESPLLSVDTTIDFRKGSRPILYDAMKDIKYTASINNKGVKIILAPYESLFVIFGDKSAHQHALKPRFTLNDFEEHSTIEGNWEVSCATITGYPNFKKVDIHKLQNIARVDTMRNFSGIIRYKNVFDIKKNDHKQVMLSLGSVFESVTVWINGIQLDKLIAPPYNIFVPIKLLQEKHNELIIHVTNTLAKQHHTNDFDLHTAHEPTGLIGPVRIYTR